MAQTGAVAKGSVMLRGKRVEYRLERKSVRGLSLRIRADGSLCVSAPYFTPTLLVEGLLIRRQDWILEKQRLAEARQAEETDCVFLWGEKLRLRVRQGKRRSVSRDGEELILTLRDPEDKEELRRALDDWRKRICAERLTALCREYYPYFERRGVPFPSLSFRRMKSRWGSCRPERGAVSFNTRLAELPPTCADYVVVHEFAHFLEPNHSAAFYAEIERVLPDWKARRKAIRAWERIHPLG